MYTTEGATFSNRSTVACSDGARSVVGLSAAWARSGRSAPRDRLTPATLSRSRVTHLSRRRLQLSRVLNVAGFARRGRTAPVPEEDDEDRRVYNRNLNLYAFPWLSGPDAWSSSEHTLQGRVRFTLESSDRLSML